MTPIVSPVDLSRTPHLPPSVFWFKAQLCSSALAQAGRLVHNGAFGSLGSQLFSRACDMLDEIDEILVGLHIGRDREAFAHAAALHRELEEIQSLILSEYRAHRWGSATRYALSSKAPQISSNRAG